MRQLALILLALAVSPQANAYFDPGTGSLIIQALIGGLAAITVFWGRLKMYVASLFGKSDDASSTVSVTEPPSNSAASGDHDDESR